MGDVDGASGEQASAAADTWKLAAKVQDCRSRLPHDLSADQTQRMVGGGGFEHTDHEAGAASGQVARRSELAGVMSWSGVLRRVVGQRRASIIVQIA